MTSDEIRRATDDDLTKRLGVIHGARWFILIGIVLIFILLDGLLYKTVIAAIMGLSTLVVHSEEKKIKHELSRRYPNAKNTKQIRKAQNRTTMKTLIICIVILAVMSIILVLSIHGRDKDGCKNCGRDVPLVSGFGYCADCYEGFVDWQKDNWTEEK